MEVLGKQINKWVLSAVAKDKVHNCTQSLTYNFMYAVCYQESSKNLSSSGH